MKPLTLGLLAGLGTILFGLWLMEFGRDDREVWVSIGAWLLGFWVASGITNRNDSGDREEPEEDDSDADDDWDEDADEEWDEEE